MFNDNTLLSRSGPPGEDPKWKKTLLSIISGIEEYTKPIVKYAGSKGSEVLELTRDWYAGKVMPQTGRYARLLRRDPSAVKAFKEKIQDTLTDPWFAVDPGSSHVLLIPKHDFILSREPYYYENPDGDLIGTTAKKNFWSFRRLHEVSESNKVEDTFGNSIYKVTSSSKIAEIAQFNKLLKMMILEVPRTSLISRGHSSILLPVDGYDTVSKKDFKKIIYDYGYKWLNLRGSADGKYDRLHILPRPIATAIELETGAEGPSEHLERLRTENGMYFCILDLGAESVNMSLLEKEGPGDYRIIYTSPKREERRSDLKRGGRRLILKVQEDFRKNRTTSVSYGTIEKMIHSLGEYAESPEEKSFEVKGVKIGTNRATQFKIGYRELNEFLQDSSTYHYITDQFSGLAEEASEFNDKFITFFAVGGLSKYKPLLTYLRKSFYAPIDAVDEPRNVTARGLQRIINDPKLLDRYAVKLDTSL